MLNILVCVKRVPATGAKIVLTDDEMDINTNYLGFTISPHEECAVEEAVRQIEKHGGTSTVLTLGPPDADKQLREALAMGVDEAILLETEGEDWDPQATAATITEAIRTREAGGAPFDLLLFGNESADSGGYQVGIRVAHALGLPCISGLKGLDVENGKLTAKREASGGWEIYEVPTPAVLSIKEGINLPRYPSMRGKLAAKKKPITRVVPQSNGGGLEKIRLSTPVVEYKGAEIIGTGPETAERVVEILEELGLVKS